MTEPAATRADIALWASLHTVKGRREAGLFLAEGEHMAGEAAMADRARAFIVEEGLESRFARITKGAPVISLPARQFQKICGVKTPQGIAALCPMPETITVIPPRARRAVALNAVQDPGNVGTILRTMDAAGFDCLLIDEKTADPFGSKALRATMGAIFRVPVVRAEKLTDLLPALRGWDILAGSLGGEDFFARPNSGAPVCILIGNEGAGLDKDSLAMATLPVRLPMPGKAESLNAAVAAAVMMYDVVRREQTPV